MLQFELEFEKKERRGSGRPLSKDRWIMVDKQCGNCGSRIRYSYKPGTCVPCQQARAFEISRAKARVREAKKRTKELKAKHILNKIKTASTKNE